MTTDQNISSLDSGLCPPSKCGTKSGIKREVVNIFSYSIGFTICLKCIPIININSSSVDIKCVPLMTRGRPWEFMKLRHTWTRIKKTSGLHVYNHNHPCEYTDPSFLESQTHYHEKLDKNRPMKNWATLEGIFCYSNCNILIRYNMFMAEYVVLDINLNEFVQFTGQTGRIWSGIGSAQLHPRRRKLWIITITNTCIGAIIPIGSNTVIE